jgi:hypothetical protein
MTDLDASFQLIKSLFLAYSVYGTPSCLINTISFARMFIAAETPSRESIYLPENDKQVQRENQ